MQARILFLGTGGDMFVIGKQMRASGGIMLNIDNAQLHLDPGPGALVMAKMMSLNLRETMAVFVTKNDLIAANDINAVASAMSHDGLDRKGVLVCPSSIVNESGKEKAPLLNKFYKDCLERAIFTDNTKRLALGNVEIETIELSLPPDTECGFRFLTEKFSLAYVPDTQYSNDLADKIGRVDILIISVLDPRESKRKEHMNCEDASKLIKRVSPQLAIATGFGIKMIEADPLYQAREMQKETGVQVIAAKDGMTINPTSFTTTVRQKSLSVY